MSKKNNRLEITQAHVRATFAVLRGQLRLANPELRIRAIYEFHRELDELFNAEVDRLAQKNGRTYRDQYDVTMKDAATWQAKQPEA